MLSTFGYYKSTVYIMPDFVPNEHMLRKHADKGSDDWEIYASCVREAIAKAGGFGLSDVHMREKMAYEEFMQKNVDCVTFNGVTYHD